MKSIKLSLVAALAATVATTGASASTLENVISNPKLDIELRPRYEYADVDSNGKDSAKALTVRTAVGLKMGLFDVDGLNAQLQGMSVDHFGWITDYNGKTGGNPSYDVVADPAQARMTQANISYTYNGVTGIFGRKMVVLDNARFIGNVGWRQMPQTYDLAAVAYNWQGLGLLGAYVSKVNKVVDAVLDTGSVILHATYTFMPQLTVTAYDYMIENFADQPGIRATGTFDLENFKIKYEAEYATQLDPSMTDDDHPNVAAALGATVANPDDIDQDADYYHVAADLIWNNLTGGISYEMLTAAGNYATGNAFTTPLATLHKFNGWADVFLNTPKYGLQDLNFKLAYNAGEYGKIVGVYHVFSSDDSLGGNDDLGDEFDAAYSYKINKNLGFLLKGAWYKEGDAVFNKNDVTKYWVQLDYKFHAEY